MSFPEPIADLELERLLSDVNELAASFRSEQTHAESEGFLERVAELRERFSELRASRDELEMQVRFSAYADHRLRLVDESEEYARATEELLTLSLVLSGAPELV